jgi:signal transduction histidine kinase
MSYLVAMPAEHEVWRRPRPTPAQQRADIWIALAIVAGTVVMILLINSMGAQVFGTAPSLTEQVMWSVLLCLPLMVRRRFPIVVFLLVSALYVAAQVRQIGDNFMPSVVLFIAMYTVGAWERNRVVARWVRIGVIVGMFAWLGVALFLAASTPHPPFEGAIGPLDPMLASVLYGVIFNLMFFVSAYFFGDVVYLSAKRQDDIEERAEQLRLSQEQNTRGAIVAERIRIARDLHDVVAHHVSVMGVQAGAARRVLDKDPAQSREALQTVEQTARVAIRELRGLLGVLRAEDSDELDTHHPTPGIDELKELVSTTRAAGVDVQYGVYGEPWPVPEAVALSAYRVAQEALTNVVKHASARTANVRVRYLEHALELEVTDDGRGDKGSVGGLGLVGMRERVAVHSGELETGPRRDGGYRVRVSFPKEPE